MIPPNRVLRRERSLVLFSMFRSPFLVDRAPEKDNFHALSLNRISAKQSPGVRGPDNAHEIDYRSVYRLLTF